MVPEPTIAPAPDYTHSVPAAPAEQPQESEVAADQAPAVAHNSPGHAERASTDTHRDVRHDAHREDHGDDYRVYTVKPGDTLSEIGERFGVDYHRIAKLNHVTNPDLIYPGQKFKIPTD
ncbi:MAG: LysM peptidoglycan-binding domain-containing protein [Tetrasphaera sp.]|nr:LysM peptidoglycan-binding domain-containing protein [Tetrasphaera sp.]